ncbi:uncharacterized protein LOC115771137 [Drosophila novamexicana]|uniref:uncharacterized protein LOC115771137 n=1 Tax=Drosophila novamexicana TaxID=47314 RepID=UPI0011E5C8B9|nr:uncharacterized protein LOC115771137 [Drosophila novamexicana]
MELANKTKMSHQLAICYRSICVNLPVFAAALGIFIAKVGRRVYRLAMSWDRIVELYSCACLVALLMSLVWYYACVAYRMLAARHRSVVLITDVVRFLFTEDADETNE